MAILCFDIGGTAVKYGVYYQNKLQATSKFSLPNSWQELSYRLQFYKTQFSNAYPIIGVSISSPGVVDVKNGVIKGISAVPYIHNFNIVKQLTTLLQLPVCIENDANCAALAELWQGAAQYNQNVIVLVIGTGIGGSIIINRKLYKGHNLFAGEFGIMKLDQQQSFSQLASTVNMVNYYNQISDTQVNNAEEIFALATESTLAQAAINRFYSFLSLGLYNLQFILDPEKIILGGGISARPDLITNLTEQTNKLLQKNSLMDLTINLETCYFSNDANLIGAAYNFICNT